MGLFDKLKNGLKKTKGGIFGSITKALSNSEIDDDMYEDLLDQLILENFGVEIDYKLGDELTEIGEYKIVLTDEIGNVAEYNFEILYSMNGGAIALIVIGVLAIVGAVVFVVLKKRRVFKK